MAWQAGLALAAARVSHVVSTARNAAPKFIEHRLHRRVIPALPNPFPSNFPASTPAWKAVTRVCRRICILRERGQLDEAEHVHAAELAPLLASCKATSSEQEVATQLDAIFAAEEERVATASVVAELLLPRLARELRAAPAANVGAPETAASVGNPDTSVAPAPRLPAPAPADIAAFIDQMFAQDDPGPPLHRRAS